MKSRKQNACCSVQVCIASEEKYRTRGFSNDDSRPDPTVISPDDHLGKLTTSATVVTPLSRSGKKTKLSKYATQVDDGKC